MSEKENPTENIKLYSPRAIGGATFLGGPLAAGYMIGENYRSLNKQEEGNYSLIIGIISTLLLFIGIFMIPENLIDNIPRQLIPLIYTGIILGIVEWKQGDVLKLHKENGNPFFSGWRAAGIGLISLIIILIVVFATVFFTSEDDIYDQYDKEITVFSKNEEETLSFYDHLNTKTNQSLLQELENKIIPKWQENIEIINRSNKLNNLPPELIEQNKLLLEYAELRLEAFELFKKSIEEDTDKYAVQLDKIHEKIEEQIIKIN